MIGLALSDIAVVLAAHGDRGGDSPNATLLRHRDALDATGEFCFVAAGVLRAQPIEGDAATTIPGIELELAMDAARRSSARHIAMFPMFMADGYFTKTVLPERVAAAGLSEMCTILPPLGVDQRLPGLMLCEALDAAVRAGVDPATARLLIVGHGSRIGSASANATRRVAFDITGMNRFTQVTTAFLEESEFLDDALAASPLPTIVSGFFAGDGMHAAEDVPEAITSTGANAIYAGSIGRSAEIGRLVSEAVRRAAGG